MKIALVSPYALAVHGGVQQQVLALSRTLSARGHDVLVVAPDVTDVASYDTPATVVRVGRCWSLPANGSQAPVTLSLAAARRARRIAIDFGADVVHLHEPFAPVLGWSLLRHPVAPTIGTFHRSGGFGALHLVRGALRHFGGRLDAAVAVSAAAARTAQQDFGVTTSVAFNGIDTVRLRQIPRTTPETVRLVTIGRLEPRKGVATAVAAVLAHNASGAAPWHLDVIGAGAERAVLEQAARGSEAITFHGALDDAARDEMVRGASALLCPALRGESFGIVLLEGMAAEVPVVASAIDGYQQAAGGHAFLAAPGDEAAWRAAIADALHQTPAAREAARRHAEDWSIDALTTLYETQYRNSLGRATSR